MKHHCHCGLERHLKHFRMKKIGVLGVVLMGAHLLFHVVECLVLPAILIGLSEHVVEEQAAAAGGNIIETTAERELPDTGRAWSGVELINFQQSILDLDLEL